MYLTELKTTETLKNKANVGGIKIEEKRNGGPNACKILM